VRSRSLLSFPPTRALPGVACPAVGPVGLGFPPCRSTFSLQTLGPAGLGGFLPRRPDPALPQERRGSPTFPSDSSDGMPRSQTPVVSCVLRPCASRTTAFRRMETVGFRLHRAKGYPCGPRLYLFRGSITRPVPWLPLAPHLHDWLSTLGSLLAGWLDVSHVGLEPYCSHPLGHNSKFPRISPIPSLRVLLARPGLGSARNVFWNSTL
jgi:hypothetical protein